MKPFVLIIAVTLCTAIALSATDAMRAHAQANGEDSEVVITGRISGMLSADGNQSDMMGQAANASDQFAMNKNVDWILSGDWYLALDTRDNVSSFEAEFIKVTTNGSMVHTHRISNFSASPDDSTAREIDSNVNALKGTSDVYFNDELAWPRADTTLYLLNGSALRIEFDSAEVNEHFHGQPIYGIVESLSEDDIIISLPQPSAIGDNIKQDLTELRQNATQSSSAIQEETLEAGRTFSQEVADVFNNFTSSVRSYFE